MVADNLPIDQRTRSARHRREADYLTTSLLEILLNALGLSMSRRLTDIKSSSSQTSPEILLAR